MKMFLFRKLTAVCSVALLLLTVAPAGAKTRKGDKLLKEGQKAEARKEWDTALEAYEQAVNEDPKDPEYLIAAYRVRFQAGQYHVNLGQKLRADGKLEEALAEFQRAYAVDPGSAIAAQELKRTLQMIERAKKDQETGQTAEPVDPVEAARQKQEERNAAILPVPDLKPMTHVIQRLQMNNQPTRVLYESVAKLAGINLTWDPDFQPINKPASVDFVNTNLEQALDYIAVQTNTFWKPLSENTIFVARDQPDKHRNFDEWEVKSYYLKNPLTPAEIGEMSTVLRGLANVQFAVPYNAQNMLLVRAEHDKVALIDKIIADIDKPRAEVVIDVLLLETTRGRTRDLAASLINSAGNAGLSLGIISSPRSSLGTVTSSDSGDGTSNGGGTSTSTSVPLSNLHLLNPSDWAVTLPNFLLQALMSDRGTKVLQSPQLRALNGVKSEMHIGDRVPYAGSSTLAGVAGAAGGASYYPQTSYQYADVGTEVTITPTIHDQSEVTLVVEIGLKSVKERIDVGGIEQPVISQKTLAETVRLHEGEVAVLGGIIQDQDTRNRAGLPGLADLPVLGHLFGTESTEVSRGELVMVLVPHIVRAPEIDAVNLRGIAVGNQQQVKLNYAPRAPEEAAPAVPVPAAPGAAAPPATPEAKPAAEAPKPVGEPKLSFVPPAAMPATGEAVAVRLQLDNGADIFGAPMRISWDPKVLRLDEASLGTLFTGATDRPIFTRNIRNDVGEVSIMLNRLPGTQGLSGSGSLVNLNFQAIAPGTTQVKVMEINVRNSQQQPIPLEPPSMTITVK